MKLAVGILALTGSVAAQICCSDAPCTGTGRSRCEGTSNECCNTFAECVPLEGRPVGRPGSFQCSPLLTNRVPAPPAPSAGSAPTPSRVVEPPVIPARAPTFLEPGLEPVSPGTNTASAPTPTPPPTLRVLVPRPTTPFPTRPAPTNRPTVRQVSTQSLSECEDDPRSIVAQAGLSCSELVFFFTGQCDNEPGKLLTTIPSGITLHALCPSSCLSCGQVTSSVTQAVPTNAPASSSNGGVLVALAPTNARPFVAPTNRPPTSPPTQASQAGNLPTSPVQVAVTPVSSTSTTAGAAAAQPTPTAKPTPVRAPATVAVPTPAPPTASCVGKEDFSNQCKEYKKYCILGSEYHSWMAANCNRFCCEQSNIPPAPTPPLAVAPTPLPAAARCEGKTNVNPDSTCQQWSNQCASSSKYRTWMATNCDLFCCLQTQQAVVSAETAAAQKAAVDKCYSLEPDKNLNCNAYSPYCHQGSRSYPWMQNNCARFCCLEEATRCLGLKDKHAKCGDFASNCAEGSQYHKWMMVNCESYCCQITAAPTPPPTNVLQAAETAVAGAAAALATCDAQRDAVSVPCKGWVGYCAADSGYTRYMAQNCARTCCHAKAAAETPVAPTPPPTARPLSPPAPVQVKIQLTVAASIEELKGKTAELVSALSKALTIETPRLYITSLRSSRNAAHTIVDIVVNPVPGFEDFVVNTVAPVSNSRTFTLDGFTVGKTRAVTTKNTEACAADFPFFPYGASCSAKTDKSTWCGFYKEQCVAGSEWFKWATENCQNTCCTHTADYEEAYTEVNGGPKFSYSTYKRAFPTSPNNKLSRPAKAGTPLKGKLSVVANSFDLERLDVSVLDVAKLPVSEACKAQLTAIQTADSKNGFFNDLGQFVANSAVVSDPSSTFSSQVSAAFTASNTPNSYYNGYETFTSSGYDGYNYGYG
mmetsp:Transcript_42211/g.82900  ORF Transcript_42211/g.82900 Transcript_42211/m.82900 type:complete len:926 (+) Transcript_42211:69-2846(+)|eukprot:CAMPEP_0175164676 /NCGR_PEP_ID=MMETSP0087-20121206/26567_1 /TAXON_ID=136419 /ORGANISM="Unknown Unknown, Strain D1" /LENGTH=925 /DNA_ID=CAMNT_0016453777 /DNA_START=74 /DNA_END=2851 /DNA_ORIENTATION=+